MSYLSQHREMLAERARSWLSGETNRPDEPETRQLLRQELEHRYGPKLKRLLLRPELTNGQFL
jgi:hypothetical protein